MHLSRCGFVAGIGLALVAPRSLWAQSSLAAAHRPEIEVPILTDEPTSVPLTVVVDHPMEADHYIQRLALALETDPVPGKGTFLFTPASGRASVAYQIRSGQGGELKVTGECVRHASRVRGGPRAARRLPHQREHLR